MELHASVAVIDSGKVLLAAERLPVAGNWSDVGDEQCYR
jgi:hypothetical protein